MQEPADGQDDIEIIIDNNISLGRGGVASVYRGTFGGSAVAIKKILRTDDYINRELIPLERDLSHENIVLYYGKREDADFIYIAMEICAGNLDHLVRGSYTGPNPGTMTEMMLQVTRGLQYLHSKDIIHRDLKPGNVLISIPSNDDELPKMKLADFGFCKETHDESSNSLSYSGVGTIGWRAPECYRIDPSITPTNSKESDIFSLGCVFGYAFSGGLHPFGNVSFLRPANIINGSPVEANLETITDTVLKQLIMKMIRKKVTDRPQLSEILSHLK